jgi:predicted RNA-binding protein with PUA-like domain
MKVGDRVLFYHSGTDKAVMGIAEVVKPPYQEIIDDSRWVAVDIKPIKRLAKPVPVATIQDHNQLRNLPLVRRPQLSVMPLSKREFEAIVSMGEGSRDKVTDR